MIFEHSSLMVFLDHLGSVWLGLTYLSLFMSIDTLRKQFGLVWIDISTCEVVWKNLWK